MNYSDFFINKFAWTTCINLLMLAVFLPVLKWDEKFRYYCKSYDGSVFGLIIMIYGFGCGLGNIASYWLIDFQSYDPIGAIKIYIAMAIFVSLIPIMVGRELWHGKKILTN